MSFKKAKPMQARLKMSAYGPTGSGKTFSSLLFAEGLAAARGGRVAYVDTEHGTDFYAMAVAERRVHPEAFDFDSVYTRSLAEVWKAVRSLKPAEHSVIVIDSITHLWQAAMDAYEGNKTRQGSIPMHAWAKIKRPYKQLIDWLIASPFDVIICGRQKNLFENDERGEMRKVGVGMRAEGETEYEPHICLRFETHKDANDSTSSTVLMHVEKDRSGVLSGRTFEDPDFEVLRPLLPLLGEEQAPAEDTDERMAQDGELMDELDEKRLEKEKRSTADFVAFTAQVAACSSLAELAEAAKAIKKRRRYLIDKHTDALRELYEERRRALAEVEAGAI